MLMVVFGGNLTVYAHKELSLFRKITTTQMLFSFISIQKYCSTVTGKLT